MSAVSSPTPCSDVVVNALIGVVDVSCAVSAATEVLSVPLLSEMLIGTSETSRLSTDLRSVARNSSGATRRFPRRGS